MGAPLDAILEGARRLHKRHGWYSDTLGVRRLRIDPPWAIAAGRALLAEGYDNIFFNP